MSNFADEQAHSDWLREGMGREPVDFDHEPMRTMTPKEVMELSEWARRNAISDEPPF